MNDRRGSALIIVLCVLCVFTVISLALLLAATTLVANEQQSADRETLKLATASFAYDVIGENITNVAKTGRNELWQYIYTLFTVEKDDDWFMLDEEISDRSKIEDVSRKFTVTTADFDELPITFTVEMYWAGVDYTADEDVLTKVNLNVIVTGSYKKYEHIVYLYFKCGNPDGLKDDLADWEGWAYDEKTIYQ